MLRAFAFSGFWFVRVALPGYASDQQARLDTGG
jgi:hypothetical protein